jgi:translation initiation factor IF-1
MAKEEAIIFTGKVIDCMPGAMFKVLLDSVDTEVIGIASGKIRQNKIRILTGDRVDVEMSPYDLSKGRIVFRHK